MPQLKFDGIIRCTTETQPGGETIEIEDVGICCIRL